MYGHIYIGFQLERYIWRDRVADVVFFLSFLFLPLHLVFTLSILEKFRYCLTLVINSIINCVWSGVQGKHLFIIVQILSMKLQEKWNKLYSFRPWWRKYGHIYIYWFSTGKVHLKRQGFFFFSVFCSCLCILYSLWVFWRSLDIV